MELRLFYIKQSIYILQDTTAPDNHYILLDCEVTTEYID